eukprot:2975817-Amphidinium_carterae.1
MLSRLRVDAYAVQACCAALKMMLITLMPALLTWAGSCWSASLNNQTEETFGAVPLVPVPAK